MTMSHGVMGEKEHSTFRADLNRIANNLEEATSILTNIMGPTAMKDSVVQKEPDDILGLIRDALERIEGMSIHIVSRLKELQERL